MTTAAQEQVVAARALYALAPSAGEAVARGWAETCIATAGCGAEAGAFEAARSVLLARDSLG